MLPGDQAEMRGRLQQGEHVQGSGEICGTGEQGLQRSETELPDGAQLHQVRQRPHRPRRRDQQHRIRQQEVRRPGGFPKRPERFRQERLPAELLHRADLLPPVRRRRPDGLLPRGQYGGQLQELL